MTRQPMPFHFAGSRLFACYHPAAGTGGCRTAVLMIQPLFGEHIQYHRAFFNLAERLASVGLPALRYDHFGTGDSASNLTGATFEGWVDDVGLAADELRSRTGALRILLIGARLGSTIAAVAAARAAHVSGMALWDPVWRGADHVDDLIATRRRTLGRYLSDPGEGLPAADGSWDLLGFHCSAALIASIRRAEMSIDQLSRRIDLLVLSEPSALGFQRPEGYDRLAVDEVEYPRGWLDPEDGIYDVLLPARALDRLVRWSTARK